MHYFIIYSSQPVGEVKKETIEEIIDISKSWNRKHEITGMLIYVNGQYLQYIEGDEQNVKKLFERIKMDRRHQQVQKAVFGFTEKRVFGQWSMGSWMVADSETDKNQALADLKKYLNDPLNEGLTSKQYIETMQRVMDEWRSLN